MNPEEIEYPNIPTDEYNKDKHQKEVDNYKEIGRKLSIIKPELKKHFTFHGGCVSCIVPTQFGLGNCRKCLYFNFIANGSLPDLSIKKLN